MISAWSAKRRILYGGGFVLICAVVVLLLFFRFFYKTPSCSDGLQNGDETGIDCGGSCTALCGNQTLLPIIHWAKAFNVTGDVYSLAAYVENQNIDSENPLVGYDFKVYDASNILIMEKTGTTEIPKNKKFIIFEPDIIIKNKIPKRIDFSFTNFSAWQRNENTEPNISITYSALQSTSTAPKVLGTVTNNSLQSLDRGLELSVLVLDSNQNAIAVSRTFTDPLPKRSSQDFVFTWPKPFSLGVEACQDSVDVALALDRSGSMRSESSDPPEPFNTVKQTAEEFIRNLQHGDNIAVVSFGSMATLESPLSDNMDQAILSIEKLSLSTTSEQTDLGDGIWGVESQLMSATDNKKKVAIILTDGVPTEPVQKGDSTYPATYARAKASDLQSNGMILYTIGLGKNVNTDFLQSLVPDSSYYFAAPTKSELSNIYKQIGASLCVKKPSVVIVLYRVL
jgi:Mg-chelatase subunit ChlD